MEAQREDIRARHEPLRKMLLRKKEEVEARIREELEEKMDEDVATGLGPVLDVGDLSTLDHDRDIDYGILNMLTQTLRDIDEALEQLDEGSYGICGECGEEIGEKRLQAIPFALNCLECQREKEGSKGKGYGNRRTERGP